MRRRRWRRWRSCLTAISPSFSSVYYDEVEAYSKRRSHLSLAPSLFSSFLFFSLFSRHEFAARRQLDRT